MIGRWLLWSSIAAGCALTSRSEPIEVRYFSPERAPVAPHAPTSCPTEARVRLGQISPGAQLGSHIVHRESAVELAPYETLEWAEQPDAYVRRAMVHALFEARSLHQTIGGPAPTLDLEIVAFEELREAGRHAGRVELAYALRDDETVRIHGSVAIVRTVTGPAFAEVVVAIGAALAAASAEIADRVAADICAK